jgi:hypothetical protein
MLLMGVKWAENLKGATEKLAVKLTRARVQRAVSLSGRRCSRNDVVTENGVGGKAKESEVKWVINRRGERAVGLKAMVGEIGVGGKPIGGEGAVGRKCSGRPIQLVR